MEVFGSPDRVQVDREILDRFGIDARWSHGVVERKSLTVKEMMMKVAHE